MIYLLETEKDDNGTLLVTAPAFPEVTTYADDESLVAVNGLAAIEEAIAARFADGENIPAPATIAQIEKHKGRWARIPLMTEMKIELHKALDESGKTRADLMRELKWNRESVDRLFRIDHRSRTEQIEDAFHALNKEVSVRVA